MDATPSRWRQVTTSQHAWEADALAALRALLPDAAPVQAWTNFQFTDGGRIHEVDALVITTKGGFVVEIKSWSGSVEGDQGTWTQVRRDGSRLSVSNPANLTAEKTRALASLVKANWSYGHHRDGPGPIFLQPLVWFSNPNLRVKLPPELKAFVAVSDDPDRQPSNFPAISDALLSLGADQANARDFRRITELQSDRFVEAMGRIGIRDSERRRTAGSYVLNLPAFAQRGAAQDFTASHQHTKRPARVRIYSNVSGMGPDQARGLKDAAKREYTAAVNLRKVDGVIEAIDFDQTDFGPAVVFDHDPGWRRLDLFLAELGRPLPLAEALRLVESLAGTLREVHKRRMTHRGLTPQSVWLKFRPVSDSTGDGIVAVPMLTDLSLAAEETDTVGTTVATFTRVGALPALGATTMAVLVGDSSLESYRAPELATDPRADGVALDVFALGALTYLLVTGKAPAADRTELRAALGQSGLSLSAVLPEVDPQLEAVVRRCTAPIVSNRFERMSDLAAALAIARAAVTGERLDAQADPLVASSDDVLAGRWKVRRRLGKGSTATALWCEDRHLGRDVVLKVSLGGACDDRIRAEGERLGDLTQDNIVRLLDTVELGGRPTLVLSFAGERSLANVLREDGAVSTEYLQRWGDDLLEALRYLEKVGVSHRDIKPDNLGIVPLGPHKAQHLVLYDFSLSSARATDIEAGTPPYLEPFLGGDRTFDLAAERYAVAVTLHEMATGESPRWGDGRSDPAVLPGDVVASLLVEALDDTLRDRLVEFLARSLRRNPAERFDTAEDMLRAWNDVFAGWEHPADDADGGQDEAGADGPKAVRLPAKLALDDPVTSFGASKKVVSALRKCGADTVRAVAELDAALVNRTKGISVRTRRLVVGLRAAVLERFTDELSVTAPAPLPTVGPTRVAEPAGDGDASGADGATELVVPRSDLDTLGLRLLPPRGNRGPAGKVADTTRALLGLDRPAPGEPISDRSDEDWPSLAAVADRLELTRSAVSRTHQVAREHWGRSADLVDVRTDAVAALADLGGVAGVSELVGPLLDVRPTGLDGDDGERLARAVLRAAVEATGDGVPDAPVAVRRAGRRTVLALDDSAVGADVLLDLAIRLGRRADALVDRDALVSASEVVPALRAVSHDGAGSLSDSRLVRLAAAASERAVANAASDLVARSAPPAAALRWCRATLVGSGRLTLDDVVERVAMRFPLLQLPPRPALDDAMAAANLPYRWDSEANVYVSTAAAVGAERLTVGPGRAPTVVSVGGRTLAPADPKDPEVVAARAVEDRLVASATEGGFLALRVPTDRMGQAKAQLTRFSTGHNAVVEVDLEATFLRHLRAAADAHRVRWELVAAADDPSGTSGWQNLSVLSNEAVQATLAEVRSHRRVLAWFPGALVRYGWQISPAPLDRLRDAATASDGGMELLWLVVLGGQIDALPAVDGTPVPIVAPSEWLEVTTPWLENAHRSAGETSAGGRSA